MSGRDGVSKRPTLRNGLNTVLSTPCQNRLADIKGLATINKGLSPMSINVSRISIHHRNDSLDVGLVARLGVQLPLPITPAQSAPCQNRCSDTEKPPLIQAQRRAERLAAKKLKQWENWTIPGKFVNLSRLCVIFGVKFSAHRPFAKYGIRPPRTQLRLVDGLVDLSFPHGGL